LGIGTIAPVPAFADEVAESPRSRLRKALIFARRQPVGIFGRVLVVVMAVPRLCAEWIAPHSPTANDFAATTESPN